VTLSEGEILGSIYQTKGDQCNPGFIVKNYDGNKIMRVSGPKCVFCSKAALPASLFCCLSCCVQDDKFYFTNKRGKVIAVVKNSNRSKSESSADDVMMNYIHSCSSGDNMCAYSVSYVQGLHVSTKSLILGVSFVIVS